MPIDDAARYDLLDRLAEEFAAALPTRGAARAEGLYRPLPRARRRDPRVVPGPDPVEQVERDLPGPGRGGASETAPPLSQVGDYRIIREIGHGGMGVVYEAEQVSLGRRVALKVLPGRWPATQALERFRREARAAARLHHTNIVPVFEVGQDGEVRYYAMQFIQGQRLDVVIDELRRLRSRIRCGGPRPTGRAEASDDAGRTADRSGRRRASPRTARWPNRCLTGRFRSRARRSGRAPRPACRDGPGCRGGVPSSVIADRPGHLGGDAGRSPALVGRVAAPGRSTAAWPRSAARRPRPWPTPTPAASSTATSSRRTCCSTPTGVVWVSRLRPGQGR